MVTTSPVPSITHTKSPLPVYPKYIYLSIILRLNLSANFNAPPLAEPSKFRNGAADSGKPASIKNLCYHYLIVISIL